MTIIIVMLNVIIMMRNKVMSMTKTTITSRLIIVTTSPCTASLERLYSVNPPLLNQ